MYEAKAYKGLKQGSLLIPAALGGNQGNPWVFITLHGSDVSPNEDTIRCCEDLTE